MVTPNQLSVPNIPTMIEAIIPDATSTVKVSNMKMKHMKPMQRRVASADCQVSVGMFSMRSKKMPSSWKTEAFKSWNSSITDRHESSK